MRRTRTLPWIGLAGLVGACMIPETGPSVPYHLLATEARAPASITVDSELSPYLKARLSDGNLATQWASAPYRAATAWAAVELAASASLASIAIKTGPLPAGASYDVQVSETGASWTPALANQRNATWNLETKTLPGGTSGKHVRIFFRNSPTQPLARFSVFELKVFAAGAPAPSPVPSVAPSPPGEPSPSALPGEFPSPQPSVLPSPLASPQAEIVLDVSRTLWPAESRLLGACRNHVEGAVGNLDAKLAKLKELKPQWGERRYLYRIGHGPTDGRWDHAYQTGFHFEQAWNKRSPYPYDDLRYGLADAAKLDADQIHVINFGTGTPEEAGRYVSFLNKADDPNRAAYPAPQQNVRLFELGNEISWSVVRGHNPHALTESVYAQRAKRFAQAMRANSDVPILIGAVGSTNSSWTGNGWSGGATIVKNILTIMGPDVDFITYHGYPSWPLQKHADLAVLMAQNEWNRRKLAQEIVPAIRQYGGGRDVRIANTEFSTALNSDALRARGMLGALYAADSVSLAMNFNMLTAVEFSFDHQDLADSSFYFGGDPNRPTPIFKFQKLLAEHWGDTILRVEATDIPTSQVQGYKETITLPRLGLSGAVSANKAYLLVTNRLNDQAVTARLRPVGFLPARVQAHTLSAPQGWDAGDADVTTQDVSGQEALNFPPASVTILEFDR